jgi:hypothetical protein
MTRTPHPVDPRQPRRRNRQPDYRHGYLAGRAAGRHAKRALAAQRKTGGCCLLTLLLPLLCVAGALIYWRTR